MQCRRLANRIQREVSGVTDHRIIEIMKNQIALFVLVILVFTRVLSAQESRSITNQRVFDTDPNMPTHYEQRVRQFESEPVVTGRVIFLGNSITEGGRWDKIKKQNPEHRWGRRGTKNKPYTGKLTETRINTIVNI